MAPRSLVLGYGLALAVIFAVGLLPSCGSAMGGLPQPQPNLNFTIGVEGVVWCKGCRYSGYIQSRDASPLRSTSLSFLPSSDRGLRPWIFSYLPPSYR
jgi:hypothetical protein